MIKLSRYKIDKYINCKRCFILYHSHSISPKMVPFSLNNAVDDLCKNEFDYYRKKQEPHPLFLEHKIDAVPFEHEKIDEWRNNFKGIRYIDKEYGYNFGGAIDDVWQKPNGELIISDVKATSVNQFDWDDRAEKPYGKGYKRQLEMYQWLFRKNGFEVANEAYLVYYNGLKKEAFFNQELKFELHLIKLDCDDSWVEQKIIDAVELIKSGDFPSGSDTCEDCNYLRKRWKVSQDV